MPALYALGFALSGASAGPLSGSLAWSVATELVIDLPAAGLASSVFGPAATQDGGLVLAGPLAARPIDSAFATLRCAALVPMLVIALGIVVARRTLRRRMLGAAGVCVAIYALIALGRTQLAALMSVAQIATEPRYHYTSLLGVAMLTTFALAALGARFLRSPAAQKLRRIAAAALAMWLGLLAIPSFRLAPSIQRASVDRARHALEETLAAISAAIAAAPDKDVHILNSDYAATRSLFGVRNDPERFPGIAALFVVTHERDTVGGKRVRFVETRAQVLQAIRAKPHRRIASLLVSSTEADALGAAVYRLPPATQ